MRGRAAGKAATKGLLIVAGILLGGLLGLPLTRSGITEALSVHFGGWSYLDNGPYDSGTWSVNERPPPSTGADWALVKMLDDWEASRDKANVDQYADDLRIRSLYIGRRLRGNGPPPEAGAAAEEIQRYRDGVASLQNLISVIEHAESQDPTNAYFPFAKGLALYYLHDVPAALAALRQAAYLPDYNDYWHESLVFEASLQTTLVSRIRAVLTASPIEDELLRLSMRLAEQPGEDILELKGLLLDCYIKAAIHAHTSSEIESVRTIVGRIVPVNYASFREKFGRSPNEGDTFRELVRLQDRLLQSGFHLDYDLAAFYGSVPDSSFRESSILDIGSRGALETGYEFYTYTVIATAIVMQVFVGIGVFCLVLLPLSRLRALRFPPIGVPALIALVSAFGASAAEGRLTPAMAFVGACFILSFAFSFDARITWLPLAIGLFGVVCAFAFLALVEGSENFLVPAIVYAICIAIYAGARKWRGGKGWIAPTIGVLVVGLAVTGSVPVPILFRAMHFVTFSLIVILGVSLWYRCELFDAAKRLLRYSPVAVLIAMVALLAGVASQAFLISEANRLIEEDKSYMERWQSNVRAIVDQP